ncbi:MAG: hypothetical protein Q7S55_04340 [Nanoarchaeota archaeon]|nr:hypothetical protein [Nanoarchaeota archaeon]
MFHADKTNPFQFYDPRSLACYSDLVVPEGVTIPTTDEAAWNHFEKHRWIYLKLNVALSQEIRCAPIGFDPDDYPVFVKPICNLLGMGVGARKVSNYEEYKGCQNLSGYFWMEHLEGEHLSHDFVLRQGEPVFYSCFRGHSVGKGVFDSWESLNPENNVKTYVQNWLEKYLGDYTGCVNVETLGSKIIECHLRSGDLDKFGNFDLMQNITNIYAGKTWNFKDELAPFFLYPVWGEHGKKYILDQAVIQQVRQNLDFCQIEDPTTYYANPAGGVRIALLGSYDQKKCREGRKVLEEHLKL